MISIVPWDTYYASHGRYVLDDSIQLGDQDEVAKAKRRHSSNILRRAELLSLAATIFVPVIGSCILYFTRSILSDPDRYINRFTISLFALATSIKPVLHLSKLIKHSEFNQSKLCKLITLTTIFLVRFTLSYGSSLVSFD